jgi:hypothetical protein
MYKNQYEDKEGVPMLSMQDLALWTNIRLHRGFAGEATYKDFKEDFKVKEICQFLGLFILHGLSPTHTLESKFDKNDKASYNHWADSNIGGPILLEG